MTPRKPDRRKESNLHLIVGEDSYLRQKIRREIIEALVPEEARAFAVQEFSLSRTELVEVERAAAAPTLLSPRQVLVLREVERLDDEEVERLERLLDSLPEFTVVIFEEERLDKRTRAARVLLEKCQVHSADSPKDAVAFGKVEEMARELGLRLNRARAEDLVFVVGTDLGTLRAELEKLRCYVGGGREVGVEDLVAVVVEAREFEIFDLIDLIAERRRADALAVLKRLLTQGKDPIPIVGLLTWLYRQLVIAQALPAGTPSWKARSQIGGPAERKEQLLRVARKFSREHLREAFGALAEADEALKSSPPDPKTVVELLVVRLTGAVSALPQRLPAG